MKFHFTVEGLKVPATNIVVRWPWFKQRAEAERVRKAVEQAAVYTYGLGSAKPLEKAQVIITAHGDYSRYDGDGPWRKDAIDAIVARPLFKGTDERRWGLVADDNRKCVGIVQWREKGGEEYKLEYEVYEC